MVTPPAPLRVVFFGTPEFAAPTLDALLRSGHTVPAVVTQPDRPSGRGHKIAHGPVKAIAVAAGVPVLQPVRLRDPAFLDELARLAPDVGVVAAYGKILTADVLASARLGFLNVHASLLPRYRGAAPVHRAIIAGEPRTGVTIMRMVQALDAGPILAQAPRAIGPDETSDEVERDLARLGAALLVVTLDEVAHGRARDVPQDESRASYAHKLTKDDGRIDWTWPAERIHNLVRGLHPWPLASTCFRDRRIIVRRTRWSPATAPAPAGVVLDASGDRLTVAAGEGMVEIVELQPEGKRAMAARDFLAGHPLAVGDRFGAP
jgi:methionyl-tRNA formyltransferase